MRLSFAVHERAALGMAFLMLRCRRSRCPVIIRTQYTPPPPPPP
jgi:hypothetical protein